MYSCLILLRRFSQGICLWFWWSPIYQFFLLWIFLEVSGPRTLCLALDPTDFSLIFFILFYVLHLTSCTGFELFFAWGMWFRSRLIFLIFVSFYLFFCLCHPLWGNICWNYFCPFVKNYFELLLPFCQKLIRLISVSGFSVPLTCVYPTILITDL